MFSSINHMLTSRSVYSRIVNRGYSQNAAFVREKQLDPQIDYIKSIIENNTQDWTVAKNHVLTIPGNVNQKNIDAILLKYMIRSKNFNVALSFTQYLKTTSEEISLGTINGLLGLYYEMGKSEKLTKDQTKFILDTHQSLFDKYKGLDCETCEKLLHALCAINEWEKALKILENIHLTNVPSHSAYSTLIATLFRINKKKKALELIEESLRYKRPLLENAYEEWINYVLRKYKDRKVIAKHLDGIYSHIAKHCLVLPMNTANRLKDVYNSLDWNAQLARINKSDGQCSCCKNRLVSLTLSDDEFNGLQQNVKERLIVGSDLFLKTSPEELKKFLEFVEKTAPYDIVLDGLNIAYAVGTGSHIDKMNLLNNVVEYFVKQKKKILLLGRQHMMRWNKKALQNIMSKTHYFFTDNLSQDDPYFITAAIISGPQTDILSKDLLRGHRFLLKDENLRLVFRRWQWQHQWMVVQSNPKRPVVQPPLKFTPCAQKKNTTWHIPVEREVVTTNRSPQLNDGTPDLYSWICLRQSNK